jgi:hypothetical protein
VNHETLLEQLRIFLPKYLSPSEQKELWEELRAFPSPRGFYLPSDDVTPDLLQGDGWRGFVAIDVVSGERKSTRGIILSNSCDVDLSNSRTLLPNLIFAPLISLAAYSARLTSAGLKPATIESLIETIRRQEVSNIFFLPAMSYGPDESVVLLDTVHIQPVQMFVDGTRTRLFRLNQVAFYVFLIKLSIHFTRLQEGVKRFSAQAAS